MLLKPFRYNSSSIKFWVRVKKMVNFKLALFVLHLFIIASINCQTQSITVNNVFVRWTNRGSSTDFFLTSSLATGVIANDAWVGVGINNANVMVSLKLA